MCLSIPLQSHYKNPKCRPQPLHPKTKDTERNPFPLRSKIPTETPLTLTLCSPVFFQSLFENEDSDDDPEVKPQNKGLGVVKFLDFFF